MFDLETFCIVRDLVRDSKGGEAYLEIRPYLQRYALNTTLTLCYGIRMVGKNSLLDAQDDTDISQ